MDLSPSSSALRTNPAGNLGVLVFGSAPITERYADGSPVLPIPGARHPTTSPARRPTAGTCKASSPRVRPPAWSTCTS